MTANPNSELAAPPELDAVIGRGWIVEVRRYILWILAIALFHTIASGGSRSYCAGGVTGAGDSLDANGEITDQVPNCLAMTLQPSPFAYLALALGCVSILTVLIRRGTILADARGQFTRSAILFTIVIVLWTGVSLSSLFTFPIELYDGGLARPDGFIFGNVEVDISPMQVQLPNPS
ncbi:hypothetical protein [Pseudoclavibacter sp. RFBA6]|uniref:hypothetical protein n=1 Tax=Pseudoclavibacter sp. RFBA6 TaxID=2080573 RepID=UPI0011AFF4A8|nr:hypothetical protein [Pseudoclavibacter sp. RFBA6]